MTPPDAKDSVSKDRLWSRIEDLAKLGEIPGNGCCRPSLGDEDKAARDLLAQWCTESGYAVRVDQVGNQFARRSGRDDALPPVMLGSHLDTQPTGGRFDGVAGVVAALEVLQTLDDQGTSTEAPVELVNWTNEEGARFKTGLTGSSVWAGLMPLETAWNDVDPDGITLKSELERIGYLGTEPAEAFPIKAFFELHIEQGPQLQDADLAVAVIDKVQHMSRFDVTLRGTEAHAGTTPMSTRRDPIRALGQILPDLYSHAEAHGPDTRLTFGSLRVLPGAVNTVPGAVHVGIDLRHPDALAHAAMEDAIRETVARRCDALAIPYELERPWGAEGIDFDAEAVAALRRACESCDYERLDLVSGAGHDAMAVANVAPAAMVFVRCLDGISHNPAEWCEPEDLTAGTNVLLHATIEAAG
ncbi:MAG: Zn-dependent hydrolase [Acidobacteriota bacterium]